MKPGPPIAEDACHLVAGRCHATGLPPDRCPLHSRVAVQDSIERRVELRHANERRCRHRAAEPHREEPCRCQTIGIIPIYRCELLQVDCADLRRPRAPATFCVDCTHRVPGLA